jgi:addiction module HigA family antidote
MSDKMAPIHPGEILAEDFLAGLGITQYRLAKGIGVPPRRINEIVKGTRGITADTALRFARFFGTSPEFWLNLQSHYDLEVQRDHVGALIDARVEVFHHKVA